MKILIDMNLPPRWVQVFAKAAWEALHWSQVGAPTASDREIMVWARGKWLYGIYHDLDFSALLGGFSRRRTECHPGPHPKYPPGSYWGLGAQLDEPIPPRTGKRRHNNHRPESIQVTHLTFQTIK